MNCRLISVSVPRIPECKTAEELIAYCARVSNPTNQANLDTAPKLLAYCIKNHHWSIFEMVSMTIEIKTTRDIGRQILRHKSFSFQEFSQRYSEVTRSSFILREARMQDKKNRQNSIQITPLDGDNALDLVDEWNARQQQVTDIATDNYQWALDNGIAKEQARAVLPEGLTMSTLYMSGTIRSWIHFIQLRSANGTQKEHQEIAKQCGLIFQREFPTIANALAQ